jgi:hypothetical protein
MASVIAPMAVAGMPGLNHANALIKSISDPVSDALIMPPGKPRFERVKSKK